MKKQIFFVACLNVGLLLGAATKEERLIEAAKKGDRAQVAQLIAERVNVDAQDERGNTALLWAVRKGHKDIVELLIIAGADVTMHDTYGNTPLVLAVEFGNKEIFDLIEVARKRQKKARGF